MSIGENIKRCREEKGLTQEKLAWKVGLSRSYIAMMERGTKPLSLPVAVEMARVMNVSLDDLVRP